MYLALSQRRLINEFDTRVGLVYDPKAVLIHSLQIDSGLCERQCCVRNVLLGQDVAFIEHQLP